MSKICLGTAKIGMPGYGYASGVAINDVNAFVQNAIKSGINCFDTSPRYGNCEEVLGETFSKVINKPFISTKIDELDASSRNTKERMKQSVLSSVAKLNIESIDLCYLHQNDIEIISDREIHRGMELLRSEGLVKEFGTSVYSKDELKYTLECGLFEWVQIPANILDTSFYKMIIDSGANTKVAARSVFLQGILLDRKSIQTDIADNKEFLKSLDLVDKLCIDNGIDLADLSIAYLSSLKGLNSIIVGTTSLANLKRNIEATHIVLDRELKDSLDSISRLSKSWTNPRHWRPSASSQ
jgi:aryl-alcohol dehydrogenase-like predicted oxidoreductase